MKRHFPQLDVLRVLACVMVVFMHSPIPSPGASGPFLAALSYVTVPCIGLFFMISGALILPVKEPFAVFIKKRLMRIAAPLLLWTLIYLATKHYYGQSQLALWREVISIPFSAQGHGVLWFMYTLTGLYLMAPILTPWLEKASKRELQGVLSVWAVTLCYPLLDYFFILNDSVTGVLYYFTGYAGYFVLGYYLRRYPRGLPGPACWTVGLGGAVLMLVLKLRGINYDFYTLFYYLSIFAACLCAGLWMMAHGIGNKLKYSALWGGDRQSYIRGLPHAHTHHALLAVEHAFCDPHIILSPPDIDCGGVDAGLVVCGLPCHSPVARLAMDSGLSQGLQGQPLKN